MRGTYMLPITLPLFHEKYPNVRIDVHEANSDHLVRLLLDGDIDLAFFNYLDPEPGLATTVISREEVVLVMHKDSEFTRYGRKKKDCRYPHMDLRLLKDQGFIVQNPSQLAPVRDVLQMGLGDEGEPVAPGRQFRFCLDCSWFPG